MSTKRRAFLRESLLLAPAVAIAGVAEAQLGPRTGPPPPIPGDEDPVHLPNGQLQQDAILKVEYEQNVKDARELTALAKSIELDFDKNDQNVLSLGLLKKLDDVEKITRRIRGRVNKK
jgi:hypothetical protein